MGSLFAPKAPKPPPVLPMPDPLAIQQQAQKKAANVAAKSSVVSNVLSDNWGNLGGTDKKLG